MICSVVVVDINSEAVISCTVPFGESTTCAVDSGFFIAPYGIPQGGIANGLHGLNPRNTAHGTPPCKRRPALVWRLVNHKYTVVTRLVDKVNKLVMRTWGFLFHTFSLERVGYLCIHPW